jgi:hypothetical protein
VSVSKEPPASSGNEPTRGKAEKQPYEKPAFIREQVFETMALSCGKANQGAQCQSVKKNS